MNCDKFDLPRQLREPQPHRILSLSPSFDGVHQTIDLRKRQFLPAGEIHSGQNRNDHADRLRPSQRSNRVFEQGHPGNRHESLGKGVSKAFAAPGGEDQRRDGSRPGHD